MVCWCCICCVGSACLACVALRCFALLCVVLRSFCVATWGFLACCNWLVQVEYLNLSVPVGMTEPRNPMIRQKNSFDGCRLIKLCCSTLNHIQHRATDTQVYSDTLPYVSKSVFCILSPPARATSRSRERGRWLARGDDHRAATREWLFSAHDRHGSTQVGGWRSSGGRDRCCPRQQARSHRAGTAVSSGTQARPLAAVEECQGGLR